MEHFLFSLGKELNLIQINFSKPQNPFDTVKWPLYLFYDRSIVADMGGGGLSLEAQKLRAGLQICVCT